MFRLIEVYALVELFENIATGEASQATSYKLQAITPFTILTSLAFISGNIFLCVDNFLWLDNVLLPDNVL